MALLGAHMSTAGGCFRGVEAARRAGCDVVQIFTENNNQWKAKPLTDEDAGKFQAALREHQVEHPLSHASYLINLGSPDDALWQKSIDAMVVELQRAGQLGIPYVVVHPGSYTTSDEASGLTRIARGLDEVHARVDEQAAQCLLENTAGQGTNLGWRFEHLEAILAQVQQPDRLGVCIDTCHTFAAGYPLADEAAYEKTIRKLGRCVGIRKVKAIHLNDSKREFGSRRDRHEHIGRGEMGSEPFRILLNDSRWRKVPMYLETPKGEDEETGRDWDEQNLEALRHLVA